MSTILSNRKGHYVIGFSVEEPKMVDFLTKEALDHIGMCMECLAKLDKANRLIGQIEAHEKYVKIMEKFETRDALNLRGKKLK